MTRFQRRKARYPWLSPPREAVAGEPSCHGGQKVAKIAPRPWESGECRLTSRAQGLHACALAPSNPLIRGACFVGVRSAQELSREGLIASGFIITEGHACARAIGRQHRQHLLLGVARRTNTRPTCERVGNGTVRATRRLREVMHLRKDMLPLVGQSAGARLTRESAYVCASPPPLPR